MHDGTIKELSNINLNDLVVGLDGKPKKVLEIRDFKSNLINLNIIKGDNISMSDNTIINLKKYIMRYNKVSS